MTFDVASFIEQVEAADPDEFADILRRPTREQDRALRAYLGDERYQRQRDLTLRRSIQRSAKREPEGNVVVIHGIMGSELSTFSQAGSANQIWVKALKIVGGALGRLELAQDGFKERDETCDVRATGILKRHYGDLLLSLSGTWRVRAFWFDWRKGLDVAADELHAKLNGWFGERDRVHIVAHSMGGLVARTFISRYREHWDRLQGAGNGPERGKLVMLGTPNRGSFAIPQVLTGIEGTVKKLMLLDLRNSAERLRAVLNSFPGTYQMLPSPLVRDGYWKGLYDRASYGGLPVSAQHLDAAREHHKLLDEVIDPERLVYVAGANQLTLVDVNPRHPGNPQAYKVSREGDGRVPYELGLLEGVQTYYVEVSHGDLTTSSAVLSRLDHLLRTGKCDLATEPPPPRRSANGRSDARKFDDEQQHEQDEVRDTAERLGGRAGGGQSGESTGGWTERALEELIVRGVLGTDAGERPASTRPGGPQRTVRVALVRGEIERVGSAEEAIPIDAIAVGHYVGVKPQQAELALDRAISEALTPSRNGREPERLLLTDYTERGLIRGELGQPFFLDDPRQPATARAPRRMIVLAGMGLPGRFGVPELTVLARELVWALGRLGKRHLATVLIGGGTGNIPVPDAVEAWLRGLRDALTLAVEDAGPRLEQLTLVESSAQKLAWLQEAIVALIPPLEPKV